MKGYTIQHSIDLLEKAVENGGGSGGGSTAADISYDNTSSGLTADDVQEAIDEIAGSVNTLSERGGYGDEVVIGYAGSDPVYRKVIDTGALPNSTTKDVSHGISNLKDIYAIYGVAYNSTAGLYIPMPGRISNSTLGANVSIFLYSDKITLSTGADMSAYASSSVTLIYTKTPPTRTSKKK